MLLSLHIPTKLSPYINASSPSPKASIEKARINQNQKRENKNGARRKYQKRTMDRARGFPIGVLCRVIWRSAVGFHSQSIRFEGGGRIQLLGLKRTGKSCRLRWVNYLHPGLKRGKMTPQEEGLVLQLHSKWGNRWSRIARKLPGRTDNEIKNFWRTHMRKLAHQNKKRSVQSPSSSSSNCSSAVDSLPSTVAGEESFHDSGGRSDQTSGGDFTDDGNGCCYSMEDLWRDIDRSVVTAASGEEVGGFRCPPMASPAWEYGQYSPWKMTEEENKLFFPAM